MRRERGQTTAEFVLVLPALLLFFFLMVDFGWILKNWIVVTNTAREAARCAVAASCTVNGADEDPIDLAEARLDAGITSNLSSRDVQLRFIDEDADDKPDAGESLIVCIQADNEYISPVLPFLSMVTGNSDQIPDPLPLRSREEMVIERVGTQTYWTDGTFEEGDCDWSS
jgi:hypothetical protein